MRVNTQRVKGRMKSSLGKVIFGLRLHHLFLKDAAVVVTFHRVNDTTVSDGLTCHVEMFQRYCLFFAKYFEVISLGTLVERINNGTQVGNELAITFDDGYQDNYEFAVPVLRAMNLPATFFVITKYIGTTVVPWWDADGGVRHSWMTWNHIAALHEGGFEIGAHTGTHVNLGEVVGEEARQEIDGSRIDLEEKLFAPVDLFAYPYGAKDRMGEENRQIVKAAGFRCCCSCFGGTNGRGTDPFYLRRIAITSWYESPHHFGFELARNGSWGNAVC